MELTPVNDTTKITVKIEHILTLIAFAYRWHLPFQSNKSNNLLTVWFLGASDLLVSCVTQHSLCLTHNKNINKKQMIFTILKSIWTLFMLRLEAPPTWRAKCTI